MASQRKRVKRKKMPIYSPKRQIGSDKETGFSGGESFAKVKESLMIVTSYKS